MVKDLTIAREIGQRTKSPLLLGSLCRELCATAMTQLDKHADHTEVARWLEMQSGFEFGEET
jgi:3-hydroxyisobutyrate dehydrogenase-like beta-hydroxyacid dehydrogenase